MATIATDGKGNYVTLDASGNWVPTEAPSKGQGELGYPPAPPEPPKSAADIDFANRPATPSPSQEDLGIPLPQSKGYVGLEDQPGWQRGKLWPVAYNPQTGDVRTAIPSIIRDPVVGLTSEGPQYDPNGGTLPIKVPGATLNPQTGTYGITPEAASVAPLAALPLKFGGPLPLPPWMPDNALGPGAGVGKPPPFLPPNTPTPTLTKITDLIKADSEVAANKPAFIPPTTSTDVAGNVTPIQQPRNPLTPATPPASNAPPNALAPPPPIAPRVATAAPADPPIMSAADIQARGRGYYNAADQAASQGAMLPDTNAAAIRKTFSDFIPSDPEAARISAGDPAMQAAKNVDATGPMSYDTAMRIDRDLTSRMRGASGSDAHDLSQLQQALRDQMDQVPDLENLRPGRQAWRQSIKQGQMEDINAGAALKNDPSQADTYVRQRAAALLKNDNAMRYWTPEEKAALTQVAQSGDIGMLGRLATALIKPTARVALATAGHAVAGPFGTIVGAEVGGDIGGTAASKFRSYLSPTDLGPVQQQITRGVPPPP